MRIGRRAVQALTVNPQTVRSLQAGALAYIVEEDAEYSNDAGFALKGWTSCAGEDSVIIILGDTATSLGMVRMTNRDGATVAVDKSWQFIKDQDVRLCVLLHHSSLEYTAR